MEAEIAKCKLDRNAKAFNLPCPVPVPANSVYQACAAIYLSWKYQFRNPLVKTAHKGNTSNQHECPVIMQGDIRGGVRSGDGQVDGDVNIVAAKVNAVKNFLSQTMKYINTELKRCELGEEKVMEGYLNCNNIDSSNGVSNTIDALTNVPAFKDNYEQGVLKEFRNPYDNSKPAVRKATAYTLGQVSISLAGKKIQLETCFKSGCGPLDRAENLIDFDQIF